MSTETRRLPLFPLNTVLFPNATIPLQVFEERYRLMVRDCLAGDSTFGVVLIKSGAEVGEPAEPYTVGTVAKIVQVSDAGEGRLFVSAFGQGRFRITQIVQTRPYIAAEVVLLEDGLEDMEGRPGGPDLEQVRRAAVQYVRVVAGLSGGWVRELRMPSGATDLSYYLPKLLQVDLHHKQTLLEAPSAGARLAAELAIVRSQLTELRERLAREQLSRFGRN